MTKMTNREKLLETFFDNIDELSDQDLARFLSDGINCENCFCKDVCEESGKTCYGNLIDWLNEETDK